MKENNPSKIKYQRRLKYHKNLIFSIAAFLFIAAVLLLSVPSASYAQSQTGGGHSILMNDLDFLNMLTNQYVIDYSRAQSLKSKVKKAPADKIAEAAASAESAAQRRQKSLDGLLNALDSMITGGNSLQIGVYIDELSVNYPSKSVALKPVFDKLKENIKFRMAGAAEGSDISGYNTLLLKVIAQESLLKNKKSSAGDKDSSSASGGASAALDFSDTGSGAGDTFSEGGSAVSNGGGSDLPLTGAQKKEEEKAEKEWTFMVYLNADNDLESAGIKDINEMEKIGSGGNINIIVQCDRSPEYDESNGNWIGARRFYIQKDDDFSKINSKEIANLGESVDMGDPAVLTDFIKWGVKNYPAKKYALVIWNHGSGWKFQNARFSPVKGISYDESSGNHLDNFKLTAALAEGVKLNGGKKFDIIIMDACLMAMVEIAYQIKDSAKVYIASEEVAPADGMPYDSILAKLAAKPSIGEKEFSAAIIEDYVRSYKGGSQGWSNCTFSAFDLSNIDALATKIDALAKYLTENFEAFSYPILLARLKTLKYSDADYADLYNFCELIQIYSKDAEASKICDEIMDLIGRPDMRGDYFESFNAPVVITDESEGVIKWTINDKIAPPADYLPAGSRLSKDGACAETPLVKNTDGLYSSAIGPFNGVVSVTAVQYCIYYKNGRTGSEKIISSANSFFTRPIVKAGAAPVIIAEGHSQSLSASRGISIYLTPFEDYLLGYKNLDFSKKYAWSSFISHKPPFKSSAKVLVVPDTGYASSDLIYSKFYHHALAQANINYDLYLPAIYGEIEEEVLSRYKDGAVIWYAAKNANCLSKYEQHILHNFINGGGRVFINGQNIEQHHGLSDFFTGCLGALYIQDSAAKKIRGAGVFEKIGEFDIGGGEGANNVSEPSIFNLASDSAQKIFTYAGGVDIAGIKNKSVIFCGFSFESIASGEARANLIKSIIDELLPPGEVKIDIMDRM